MPEVMLGRGDNSKYLISRLVLQLLNMSIGALAWAKSETINGIPYYIK